MPGPSDTAPLRKPLLAGMRSLPICSEVRLGAWPHHPLEPGDWEERIARATTMPEHNTPRGAVQAQQRSRAGSPLSRYVHTFHDVPICCMLHAEQLRTSDPRLSTADSHHPACVRVSAGRCLSIVRPLFVQSIPTLALRVMHKRLLLDFDEFARMCAESIPTLAQGEGQDRNPRMHLFHTRSPSKAQACPLFPRNTEPPHPCKQPSTANNLALPRMAVHPAEGHPCKRHRTPCAHPSDHGC
jgi:hypothetical protein